MARKLAAVPAKSAGDLLVESLLQDFDDAGLEPDSRGRELLEAVRALRDRMESLQAAIAAEGETSVSSSGMVRLHPGIAEHRAHARTLSLLLAKLEVGAPEKNSAKVRAAEASWRSRHAKRGA
ncbi:hypothetical protein KO481_21445 [Nocardia sp. NEAU-G5]|uniref:Terminase small subunit n=1 Tax=Nocardia albiluteola TaxID=2842303 RepID=A0ABS6B1B7_9NOCA|nr:hypothetical protein [Nocardia albiluteola]MBU3064084.1 hypothetical protein [Nocardia albiluteola]